MHFKPLITLPSNCVRIVIAGAAQIAGVQLATVKNKTDGTFCLKEMQRKLRLYDDCHEPVTALVIVENTHNMCGGKVLPLQWLNELAAICKDTVKTNDKRIALHMDGARIFNAAAFLQVPVARITKDFDSVCFCLSKGLSAPVGSVLVGNKAFINEYVLKNKKTMKWRSVCSRKSSKTKWQTWEAMSGYQKVEQLLLKAAIKKK